MQQVLRKLWIKSQENGSLRFSISFIYNLFNNNKRKVKGKKNELICKEGFLKGATIKIVGNNNKIIFKKNARFINSRITVSGNNHTVVVGENCIIRNTGINLEDSNCEIFIDDYTTIEGVALAAVENHSKIAIGKDCMFSADIEIRTSDSHSIIDSNSKARINNAKNIKIGNHVWIGQKATILKGINIGDNSIIGIGSIVTKSVPSNSLAVGIPAKVVKNEITWLRERI